MNKRRIINSFLCLLIVLIAAVCFCSCNKCEHNNTSWVIDSESSLDGAGTKHLECEDCGQSIETQEISQITKAEAIKSFSNSLLHVRNYDYDGKTLLSEGSGFFIDSKGNFVTNAHVIKDTYYSKVTTKSGRTYDVDKIYSYNYASSDYAICHAKNVINCSFVNFSEDDVHIDDKVYALGFPNGIFSFTEGVLLSDDVIDGSTHYYEFSTHIDEGSSGGILCNGRMEVVGITTCQFDNKYYGAIRYKDIKSVLNSNHVYGQEPVDKFHTVRSVSLGTYNVSQYFNLSVVKTSSYGGTVNFRATMSLKPEYANKKMLINNSHLYFSIRIDVDYSYYSTQQYISGWKTGSTLDFITLYMYSYSNFYDSGTVSANISIYGTYTNLSSSFDYDYSGVVGTLIIYD